MGLTRLLWTLSFAQFLAMQVWFNFSAVMPVVEREWGLSSTQSGIIVGFFHIGYVAAVFFYSFLSDRYNPKYSFMYGAMIAGLSGILFSVLAQGFWSALLLRFISGVGIAGIYVPGMKIVAQTSSDRARGAALGLFVGSLVVGSGFSLLVSGLFINLVGWKGVIFITSCSAILAASLIYFSRIPENIHIHNQRLSMALLKRVLTRRNLLVNISYTGHCWELYAMWAWIGPFMVYYFQTHSVANAISVGNFIGAFVVMIGGVASFIGGRMSDSFGRLKSIKLFIYISIACSLSIGWLTPTSMWILLPLVFVYGFTIIADSPIYNTMITEISEPEITGIALGIQSVLGFSATIFSPMIFGMLLDYFNWGIAFTTIGVMTIITPISISMLRKKLSVEIEAQNRDIDIH
ncbi:MULTISPECIES: MFS transporter [unclassified Mesobacillus]|uniref:MFS transporter n=1 Tax=unclassified Mesobacillus TaxID=2675270 RepID=UPI00203F56A3|nr:MULTISPECIES: MFS transporter [unclassified Mesobacillus]MCM3125960.1 MFS transporter [Mesobacillus sp. MER 33]MCM3235937.1 MFS transporter [Mesobacillus sp. MER 48]